MGEINTKELLAGINIIDVIGKTVKLKKKGVEYVGLCPFHEEKSPSFSVNEPKGIYKCFGCGKGGNDAIAFLMEMGSTFHEACAELSKVEDFKPKYRLKQNDTHIVPPVKKWTQISHPDVIPEISSIEHYLHGKPSAVWTYHNEDGTVNGFVCRFDIIEDGKKKKEVLPYIYATDGTRKYWGFRGFDEPRPLYDLHLIKQNPTKNILVVEGEKTAEAAKKLLPGIVVTCWIGGANGIGKTDFSPLNDRKVMLWPDNDFTHEYGPKHEFAGQIKPLQEQPGNAVMIAIANLIAPAVLKYIKNPIDVPDGWDLADSDFTPESVREYIKENLSDTPPYSAPAEATKFVPPPPPVLGDTHEAAGMFKFLGWSKVEGVQHFTFFTKSSKAVITLSVRSLTNIVNLMMLAPLNWWESTFPTRSGCDTNAAAQWIISNSNSIGPYRGKFIRGRGAWVDAERIIIHDGEQLIVNGLPFDLGSVETKFIYETAEPLGFNADASPLSVKEANRLMDVLQWLNWERPVNSHLLAGWCVIAPFCGSLKWRPHIWLSGAAGTGKSWVFKNIVRPLLGDTCIAVQGATSEPGLRQLIGYDALPVIFDEAEGEDRGSQERMQTILGLMRSASAEDGGIMVKGSAGGGASKSYRIRSCFAFASIGLQVAQQSDRTRVTILSLRGLRKEDPNRAKRWTELQKEYDAVITDDFVKRLQARTIRMLPTILENTRTFANAAAAVLGEQRFGDQLGALLAGSYSLYSNGKITFDEAKEWVSQRDWSEERSLDSSRDEIVLINYILQHNTQIEGEFNRFELSVGEIIEIAAMKKYDSRFLPSTANDRLKRLGISVNKENTAVRISHSHKILLKILEQTPWSKNHNKTLMRLEGAIEIGSCRFAGSVPTRAVSIPINSILKSEENIVQSQSPQETADNDGCVSDNPAPF